MGFPVSIRKGRKEKLVVIGEASTWMYPLAKDLLWVGMRVAIFRVKGTLLSICSESTGSHTECF